MESDQLIVLASRKRNGISDVVSYRRYVSGASVAVEFTALLVTDNMAALEAQCSVDDEKRVSGYPWTHTVIWRRDDRSPKKKGHGGKYTWSGDGYSQAEIGFDEAIDANDPNFEDPEDQKETVAV